MEHQVNGMWEMKSPAYKNACMSKTWNIMQKKHIMIAYLNG